MNVTSSLERIEWVKMNLDTIAAVNTFPLNFGPAGTGNGDSLVFLVMNGFLMKEFSN